MIFSFSRIFLETSYCLLLKREREIRIRLEEIHFNRCVGDAEHLVSIFIVRFDSFSI